MRLRVDVVTRLDRDKLAHRLAEIVLSADFNAQHEADYIIETCTIPDPRLRDWENESERQEHRADRWEREWETANRKIERIQELCDLAFRQGAIIGFPDQVRACLRGEDPLRDRHS